MGRRLSSIVGQRFYFLRRNLRIFPRTFNLLPSVAQVRRFAPIVSANHAKCRGLASIAVVRVHAALGACSVLVHEVRVDQYVWVVGLFLTSARCDVHVRLCRRLLVNVAPTSANANCVVYL